MKKLNQNERLKFLENEILRHKKLYYSGKAEISDESFDQLEKELRELDPQSPILNLVGSQVLEKTGKVKHQKKMLSLEKTYDENVLSSWIKNEDVLSIFKIDGSSCSLVYEMGRLKVAKTRGDGQYGEDITSKVLFIEDIPKALSLNIDCEVRGEIFCIEKNFFDLSNEMVQQGLEAPSSQRNIVAGLLSRKENIQLARFLSFQAFDFISERSIEKESQKLDLLKSLDFSIPDYLIHKGQKGLKERILEAKNFMSNGEYLIDGIVFVYENLSLHEKLGHTAHHPKYKLAYKFEGETKVAEIQNIEWGVSRNGVLTPVARIVPTELSGAIISRVTLHNWGLAHNFKLVQGDKIEIIRSGEVIPKFLRVIEKKQSPFDYPHFCPSCHEPTTLEDIWLKCTNENCPAKNREEILNYIQKSGIDDISDKRLQEMLEKKLISKLADLYKLTPESFLKLDKVKEKLAVKMYENIQKSKTQSLATFVSSIGIEGVSVAKSEKIIQNGFKTLEQFMNLTSADLMKIDGFAEKSSQSIVASIRKKRAVVEELLNQGVSVQEDEVQRESLRLEGKKFCLTGQLSQPRSIFENLIKSHGGILANVSKNLDYLVTNELESQSSKFLKAKKLKIPMINENQLRELIENE